MIIFLFACQKESGKGGLGIIQGKVHGYILSSNGIKRDSGYIQDHRVYISYGQEDVFLDDDVRSSVDGSYRFDELQKGKYIIWTFGDCPTCPMQQSFDSIHVEIKSTKDVLSIRDLLTYLN